MSWFSQEDKQPSPSSTMIGNVLGLIRKRGRPAKPKAISPEPAESTASTSTSVTGTENTATRAATSSTTSATSTTSPSSLPTVWTMSLTGFAESDLQTIMEGQWDNLDSSIREPLFKLAEGRGEPPEQTLREIVEFLADDNNNVWQDAPIVDALTFYFQNELIYG